MEIYSKNVNLRSILLILLALPDLGSEAEYTYFYSFYADAVLTDTSKPSGSRFSAYL